MIATFALWFSAAPVLPAPPPKYTTDQYRGESETELLQAIADTDSKADHAMLCKKLAFVGTADAVPVLADFLRDEQLASWARIALEAIPDPAADEALVSALGELGGRRLIGVIQSVAKRETVAAVEPLIDLCDAEDEAVAAAAAISLGTIGGDEARNALIAKLESSDSPSLRSAAAEGLIVCAERLLADGRGESSVEIYEAIRSSDLPQPRITEATRGAIVARGIGGIDLLAKMLQSEKRSLRNVALLCVRQLEGPDATAKLIELSGTLDSDLRRLMIVGLAERGDASATDYLLDVTADDDASVDVRLAAVTGLSRLADAGAVDGLLDAAADENEAIASAAVTTLASLGDDRVDEQVLKSFDDADAGRTIAILNVIAARRIDAADQAIDALDSPREDVRAAALVALGEIATLDQLPELIRRSLDSGNPDQPTAIAALRAAAIRMPDREATAAVLVDASEGIDAETRITLLEVLAAMGGPTALEELGRAGASTNPKIQDAASRLLGTWMTIDAGPVLLRLAKQPGNRYQVRALRGYLRIVRQFLMDDDQRLAMAKEALSVAQRDEEKRLVLDVVVRYPSVEMIRLAKQIAADPALSDEAKAAAKKAVEKIGDDPEAKAIFESM